MKKAVKRFVCQECGSWYNKWTGRCDGCAAWNTLAEEIVSPAIVKQTSSSSLSFVALAAVPTPIERKLSHIQEFDRVCGGGLVPGSALLVGGDPGIGKSTLLLQVTASLSQQIPCAYISGEESIDQVRLRAQRLGLDKSKIYLAASTNTQEILGALNQAGPFTLVVIDSIQTMASDTMESAPGTVSQVRSCAHELITEGKKQGIVMILVGHVTKEGTLAGPRVLEHMVDTVLYFEGDTGNHYRILRSIKNRYGATDEIGVFEMTSQGLQEVKNPSALFLSHYRSQISGSAIFAGMEGTRPVLVEIQALVTPSYLPTPRRTVVGWDSGRLAMTLAVLEARCRLIFGNKDVYLNVAGGLKITEPAADLAVAAALVSALKNTPLPANTIFFGEIGLAGEIRAVSQNEVRLREAEKLGFYQAFLAESPVNKKTNKEKPYGSSPLTLTPVAYLQELAEILGLKPDNPR